MGTLPIMDRAGCTNPTGEPASALSVQEQQEQRRGDTVWPQGPGQDWPQAPHTTALAGLGITGAPKQEERVSTAPGRLLWAIQTHQCPQGRQLITLTVFFNFTMRVQNDKKYLPHLVEPITSFCILNNSSFRLSPG